MMVCSHHISTEMEVLVNHLTVNHSSKVTTYKTSIFANILSSMTEDIFKSFESSAIFPDN